MTNTGPLAGLSAAPYFLALLPVTPVYLLTADAPLALGESHREVEHHPRHLPNRRLYHAFLPTVLESWSPGCSAAGICKTPTNLGLQATSSLPRHHTDNLLQPSHLPALRSGSTKFFKAPCLQPSTLFIIRRLLFEVPACCRRIGASYHQLNQPSSGPPPAYLASSPHVCRKGRESQEQDVNKVSSAFLASVLLYVKLRCCNTTLLFCGDHSCSRHVWIPSGTTFLRFAVG